MARKQALSPDTVNFLKVGIPGPGKPQRASVVSQFINGALVPSLCEGWQTHIEMRLSRSLSAHEIAWFERVIGTYIVERVVRKHPIPWKKLLARLEAVSVASELLLDEIDDRSPAAAAMWQRIGMAYCPSKPANILQNEVRQFKTCTDAEEWEQQFCRPAIEDQRHQT